MENLVNSIYETYLKPRDKKYELDDSSAKLLKSEIEFQNTFSFKQRKMYEEIEYLTKKLNHQHNLDLIEFTIKYLTKKEEV